MPVPARIAPAAADIPALQARLEADDKDSDARYRLAIGRVVAQDFDAATEELLHLMARDPGYADGAAREALLKLFDLLGDDPLVAQARRRMFNLLH